MASVGRAARRAYAGPVPRRANARHLSILARRGGRSTFSTSDAAAPTIVIRFVTFSVIAT
jgi:hypothetical protein